MYSPATAQAPSGFFATAATPAWWTKAKLNVDPAADIVVWDGHGGIVYELFRDRARLLLHPNSSPPYGLDATFDAVFLIPDVTVH
ncbi:MAG: hypothetical protein ACRDJN_21850 [Chloroflexota bacterium]